MVDVTKRDADAIVEAAIAELRRNRRKIGELLPCSVTIHFPPAGSADAPCLEVKAKLKPSGLSCDG